MVVVVERWDAQILQVIFFFTNNRVLRSIPLHYTLHQLSESGRSRLWVPSKMDENCSDNKTEAQVT
jgi:hypothetical protein